jgi:hypothetical protein
LRDVYVHNADEELWQKFLVALASSHYSFSLQHGKRQITQSVHKFSFDEASRLQETDPVLLQIELSPAVVVNCHFFWIEEIEMDVDPRQLESIDAVGMVVHFMQWLASIIERPVLLTHENNSDELILKVEPRGADNDA